MNMSVPTYCYVAVKGSLHASDCSVFGLIPEEVQALSKKYPSSIEVINGMTIKGKIAFNVLNYILNSNIKNYIMFNIYIYFVWV
jgi:hypothetical protein